MLRDNGIPSTEFWVDGVGANLRILFVIAGLVGIAYTAVQAVVLLQRLRQLERGEALEEYATSLLVNFHEATGLPATCLTVHVWKASRDGSTLERLVGHTFDTRIGGSGVEWKRGKGAIGRAWDIALPFTADLAPLHAAYTRGRADFEALPDADRFNLSYREFGRSRYYWSVYVAPLRVDGRLIGVASVGCTKPRVARKLEAASKMPAVDEPITLIEGLVAKL